MMEHLSVGLAQEYGRHMDWNSGAGWAMFTAMVVFGLLVLGIIVWAVLLLSRSWHGGARSAGSSATNARQLLDERFARGDIDAADYEERRRLLG